MTQTKTPVTVYIASAFGISKTEANLESFGKKDYAQYRGVPFVRYVPKGKRKPTGHIATAYPYLVVIEGHGHIAPGNPMTLVSEGNGATVTKSMYASFDERYKTDFDKTLTDYLADKKVLIDYRHTAGTTVIDTESKSYTTI